MYPEFHYQWEQQLKATPEQLWPLVSDTNRFNRDTGVPAVAPRATPDRLINGQRRLQLFRFGVPIEWDEEPFEWLRPYRFGVARRYRRGPVAEMRVRADLAPAPGGGTHLVYQVWARPANPLGLLAIPAQIGLLGAMAFNRTMRDYDRRARFGSATLMLLAESQLSASGRSRLALARAALLRQPTDPALVERLLEVIHRADDLTAANLRPYALADAWGAPRRAVLELSLRAVRAGLLELRWNVLCPLCRGAKETAPTLSELQTTVHCDTCNIDYIANFERSVELTFRPNAAIRPISESEYCLGGPQLTPHIIAQQLLAPGETRALALPLEAGRYRLRALELPGGQALQVTADGQPEISLTVQPAGWPNDEPQLAPTATLQLRNQTAAEQLLILERTAWSDQAVTAAEITTLQTFRDLFANEALRPGEQISVGSLTIVFTDLRDSTRLYREVGDAVAFGQVMDHFDILRAAIVAEGGAVVKTIGDAVMAVFLHPLNALRAMIRAQHELASPPAGKPPLGLKAGGHYGPCITVRLNDRLDYFGSTVNFAARLTDLSTQDSVIISAVMRYDPAVSEYLAQAQPDLAVEVEARHIKGFDNEIVEVWRVRQRNR